MNRVALVTGSSHGIGATTIIELAKDNHTKEAIKRIKDSLSFFKKNCTNNIL